MYLVLYSSASPEIQPANISLHARAARNTGSHGVVLLAINLFSSTDCMVNDGAKSTGVR